MTLGPEELELAIRLEEAKRSHGRTSVETALVLLQWVRLCLKAERAPKLNDDDIKLIRAAYDHTIQETLKAYGMESTEMQVLLREMVNFARRYGVPEVKELLEACANEPPGTVTRL